MRIGLLAGVTLLASICGSSGTMSQVRQAPHAPQWCLSVTSEQGNQFRYFLVVIATDSTMDPVRTSLGIPAVDSSTVRLLRDEARCKKASAVVGSLLELPSFRPVLLSSYGAHYAAYDPEARLGEFTPVFFFDSTMAFIGSATI